MAPERYRSKFACTCAKAPHKGRTRRKSERTLKRTNNTNRVILDEGTAWKQFPEDRTSYEPTDERELIRVKQTVNISKHRASERLCTDKKSDSMSMCPTQR